EGTKPLPELDLEVHLRLHAGAAGISQDAARAERAGPELHATVEPADHLLLGEQLRHALEHAVPLQPLERRTLQREIGRDLVRGEGGAEVRPAHRVVPRGDGARSVTVAMPD